MRTRASVWRGPATGFRSNSNRSGTTPAHDWVHWPDEIRVFVERLQGVVIESKDALEVMRNHDRADALHYVDPPYVRATRSKARKRKSEYLYELEGDEHRELSRLLHRLRGYVVLSGYPCELYDELYRGWPTVEREALADGARPRTERLWLSPRTAAALEEGPLFAAARRA